MIAKLRFVTLSEAKGLGTVSRILRFAQNDGLWRQFCNFLGATFCISADGG